MRNDFEIELAVASDAERIAELFAADMSDLGMPENADAVREVARAVIDDDHAHVFVARDGDRTIGVLLANDYWSIKFPGKALWIEELYVAPEARRRGLGRTLVEALLDWALPNGFAGVELEAYRMNTAASILYRSLGFSRLARERYSFDLSDWELDD